MFWFTARRSDKFHQAAAATYSPTQLHLLEVDKLDYSAASNKIFTTSSGAFSIIQWSPLSTTTFLSTFIPFPLSTALLKFSNCVSGFNAKSLPPTTIVQGTSSYAAKLRGSSKDFRLCACTMFPYFIPSSSGSDPQK